MQGGPDGLSPAFAGEHAWCREKMMLAAELAGGVPLPVFFADGGFRRAIDRYAQISGGSDRRAVVSMWSLYYFSGLTIPYLLARRIAGQVLPVAFKEMTIMLEDNGLPGAFGVSHAGTFEGEMAADGFETAAPLIETHLGEAVSQLKAYGISAKLCWNNAAVYIDYALRLTAEGRAFEGSDLPFFTESCLPGGGVNPFRGCLQHVEEDGERVARRKVCCLRYMLPGIPSCGKLCALPAQRSQ
jgi:ferric iron reductase protein FhuF